MTPMDPDAEPGAALRPVLAAEMAELRSGEPGMPDLLGPAMAEGTRIRRRRRTTLLVALGTAVVLIAGGVVGGLRYVGGHDRGVGPASSPTATNSRDAAATRALPPVQALAETLRPHLEAHGITLTEKPWGHTDDGVSIILTVRDANGRTGALTLSTGQMESAPPSRNISDADCEVPAKLDRAKTVEYDARTGVCKLAVRGRDGAMTWAVVVPDTRVPSSVSTGATRLGPDRDIVRVWTWSATPEATGQLVFEQQMLIDIAADPDMASSVRAVAAATGMLTPPPAWRLDTPAPTATPTGSRKPRT